MRSPENLHDELQILLQNSEMIRCCLTATVLMHEMRTRRPTMSENYLFLLAIEVLKCRDLHELFFQVNGLLTLDV